MNREDIIQMANEALVCQQIWIDEDDSMALESVILFAKLVAGKVRKETLEEMIFAHPTTAIKLAVEKEREACAKMCDDIDVEYEGEDVLATWCSRAIRARGEA